MKTLPPYLQRPRIHYRVGFGWNTDRLYDERNKKQKTIKK